MSEAKRLLEHVLDATFRASRHAGLLLTQPLPKTPPAGVHKAVWSDLLRLQAEYRRATRPRERLSIASEFGQLVDDVARAAIGRADDVDEMKVHLSLTLGLPMFARGWTPEQYAAGRRVWRAWSREHGQAWLAGEQDRIPPPPSLTEPPTVTAADRRRLAQAEARGRRGARIVGRLPKYDDDGNLVEPGGTFVVERDGRQRRLRR